MRPGNGTMEPMAWTWNLLQLCFSLGLLILTRISLVCGTSSYAVCGTPSNVSQEYIKILSRLSRKNCLGSCPNYCGL